MKLVYVWVCLLPIFISLEGCFHQERFALLQLKPFFNSPYYLQNWVDVEGNFNCCRWERVECSNTTNRVINLDLSYIKNEDMGEWHLNASLFSAFEELESLDLSNNFIVDCVKNEGFERLSHLKNISRLYLDGNLFNDSHTLSALCELPSLKYLYLSYNRFRELNYINVSRLSNLEGLYLSGNSFNNNSILSSLSTLSSLKVLSIYDIGLKGTINIQELDSLSNLETLAVGGNEINKFVFPKGDTGLKKLNSIYLWNVSINDGSTLLQSLGSFPSLKTVDLFLVNFSGGVVTTWREKHKLSNVVELSFYYSSLPVSLLSMFTSLEQLEMYDCELKGILTGKDSPNFNNLKSFWMYFTTTNINNVIIKRMTSLQTLEIYECNLTGTLFHQDLPNFNNLKSFWMVDTTINIIIVPQIIKRMTSLQTLEIYGCNLTGTLFHQGICDLLHLEKLYLDGNNLNGALPSCLANLTSLKIFDISSNNFTGNISSSPLKLLTSIQELRLAHNHFQIPSSLEPFFNLSKLKIFDGSEKEIYADVESYPLADPKFQLNSIILPGCRDGGSFPKFLYNQHDLHIVDLSHSNLRGEFPNWLLDNNTKLERLILGNNSLSRPLQLPFRSHMYLKELDISKNSFCGYIPAEVGAYLPSLESFNASRNAFKGTIPSSFGDMKSLGLLDLSNNFLMGEIPEHLTVGCFSLKLLVLSYNGLRGQIFSTNFNLINLMWLQLEGNNFSGRIPDSLSKSAFLLGLYLGNNSLSGRLPSWLGNMTYLNDIVLDNNHLEGPIPLEFCQLDNLVVLDLSSNNITGNLPSCLSPSSIEQVHLSRNRLQGQLKGAFSNSSSLVTLDIQYNNFTGTIPEWIGRHYNMTYLILSHNNFEGEIPTQLCHLDYLHLMDLSHNNLFGCIPSCFNITAIPTNISLHRLSLRSLPVFRKEEILEFTTKKISYSYRGRILSYFSGIDLSCNKLIGEIPCQIGNLVDILTLNLSHNNLTGSIPSNFSNLRHLESMDLSYNNLNGQIPEQLVYINALEVFSVAHNNLSGKIPDMTAQFGTFKESSYEGNPLLCGQPLLKSCNATVSQSPRPTTSSNNREEGDFIDMDMFYVSFTISFIIALLAVIIVLYINPHWRQTWFYLVEMWLTSCYYFVVDYVF